MEYEDRELLDGIVAKQERLRSDLWELDLKIQKLASGFSDDAAKNLKTAADGEPLGGKEAPPQPSLGLAPPPELRDREAAMKGAGLEDEKSGTDVGGGPEKVVASPFRKTSSGGAEIHLGVEVPPAGRPIHGWRCGSPNRKGRTAA